MIEILMGVLMPMDMDIIPFPQAVLGALVEMD